MTGKPLCIDLCCGIGGWAAGFLAAGYRVVGFDIRRFPQGYPGDLVLQDIRMVDGAKLRGARVIVASPPCEQFSVWRFPWRPERKVYPALGVELFAACRRIIREAQVPGIIENVAVAQRWVGQAATHFGSFYLWGDVPLLRPQMRFAKGAYVSRPGRTRLSDGSYRTWRPRQQSVRAAHLRARIPFDLAYWLAQHFLTVRMT